MRCMVTCNIVISIITYHKIEVLLAILHLGDNEYQVEEIVFQMAHWSQIFSSIPELWRVEINESLILLSATCTFQM